VIRLAGDSSLRYSPGPRWCRSHRLCKGLPHCPKEGTVHRLLPIFTLVVLGGLGWLFLQGGGLSQFTATSTKPAQPSQPGNDNTNPWSQPGVDQSAPTPLQPSPLQASTQKVGAHESPAVEGATIRIASFNIQVFGNAKASNPPVIRTLAEIVRQFDLVAIQEVRSKNEYLIPNFVNLINQAGVQGQPDRHYDHVIGPRLGNTSSKEQYVFIFDTDRVEIDPHSVYTVSDPDGLLHREPLVATFRARGVDPQLAFTFTLVNIHTDPDQVPEEMDALADVYRSVRRSSRGEDDILLLGDFNTDNRHLYRLGDIAGIYPLVVGTWTNTRQNKQYDNLIIHRPSTTEHTGRWGVFDVVRQWNLTEQQALQVSDHFPVWAEFSVYERDFTGRIASRRKSHW
jgi:deoxyribonuclease-1-like protein